VPRHTALRQCLQSRWFWKQSHPPLIAAAVGLALVLLPGDVVRRSVAGLLTIPYLRLRPSRVPLWHGRKRRIAWLPAAFVADLNEVAVMVTGSLRFRRFLRLRGHPATAVLLVPRLSAG